MLGSWLCWEAGNLWRLMMLGEFAMLGTGDV